YSNLEQRRNRPRHRRLRISRDQRKDRVAPVLEDAGNLDAQVSPRKSLRKIVAVVDLRPTLILGLVWPTLVPSSKPGIDSDSGAKRTTDRCGPRLYPAGHSWEEERIVDDGRQAGCVVGGDHPHGDPWPKQLESDL